MESDLVGVEVNTKMY